MANKTRDPEVVRVVRYFGGLTNTARHFAIEPPSVFGWYERGIPPARRMYLEAAHPDALKSNRRRRVNH